MKEILKLYDEQVRKNPITTPDLSKVDDNGVLRVEGFFNFVWSWDFTENETESLVTHQAECFRQKGDELMWRVFEHDRPSNIELHLKQQGFKPCPQSTLMVLPLEAYCIKNTEHQVKKVNSEQALRDFLQVAAQAFECDSDESEFNYFAKVIDDAQFALYCTYEKGVAVAAGRMEIPKGSSFGLMFGGSVLKEHRGKGYYQALITARIKLAKSLGLKYLSTEARETSRPILEKLGFISLVKETTWVLPKVAKRLS
ncbi:MAG: GNAT family N-acetyltransferase [Colwellia sp.]|nr:GNAT family N-acetyltransferase [Colwellia sp.]